MSTSTTNLEPTDLAVYMGIEEIDETRARLFLSLAEAACLAYVNPLPAAAKGVVLKLAANGYTMPVAERSEHAGPFSIGMAPGTQSGLTPSAADVRTLRLLAGRGGAFTIDPTPSTAARGGTPWDTNVTWLDGVPLLDDGTDQ